jgi:hypothetical protein
LVGALLQVSGETTGKTSPSGQYFAIILTIFSLIRLIG